LPDEHTGREFVFSYPATTTNHYPNGGTLTVLDARTHALVRRAAFSTTFDIIRGAVDERTGRVFIEDPASNGVAMLDGSSGALLRLIDAGAYGGLPLVDGRQRRVFLASGNIGVLDAVTGHFLGGVDVSLPGPPTAAVVDEPTGRIFEDAGGQVSLFDAAAAPGPKMVLGTVAVGQQGGPMAVDGRTGHVYVDANYLYELDGRTAAVLGQGDSPGVPGGRGSTLAVNTRSRRLYVTYQSYLAQVHTEGVVYVLNLDAPLGPGAVLHSVSTGSGAAQMAVDERRDRLIVVLSATQVAIMEGTTGRILHVVTISHIPDTILKPAVDEQTGQVYVTSTADGTVSVFNDTP
jgi:DNA-binding beta-propeller fold protein YncE